MESTKRDEWSQRVTNTSSALDLKPGIFTCGDPRRIAQSLKRCAERSRRRKADPFRSARSMLTFYINRAGVPLSTARRKILEDAKDELRDLFGRPRQQARGSQRSRRRRMHISRNSLKNCSARQPIMKSPN